MYTLVSRYRLDIVAFIAGGLVMTLELSASRVLAPYMGLSLYVWTSIIGIILAAMSLGYWLGGIYADRNPTTTGLQRVLFVAGCAIGTTAFLKDAVAAFSAIFLGSILGPIVASVILFLPPGIFLAMVSPYALRLKLSSVETGGKVSGSISAFSTLGSIMGTFLAGFLLIPHMQTIHILIGLAAVSALSALLLGGVSPKKLLVLLVVLLLGEIWGWSISTSTHIIASIPSPYALITIKNAEIDGRPARIVVRDSEIHAGTYQDTHDPAFPIYRSFSTLDAYFAPHPQRALLLGGGIYDVATRFLDRYSTSSIDAVEIDPEMTRVAETYFHLTRSDRLHITHEDARVFLNQSADNGAYDIIYNDSFSSFYSVPFQLTTKEAVAHMRRLLREDGIVLSNIVSGLEGKQALFLNAEYKTFASVFPFVRVFAVGDMTNTKVAQNFLLVASARPIEPRQKNAVATAMAHKEVFPTISERTPILSDEFAPVDYFVSLLTLPGRN